MEKYSDTKISYIKQHNGKKELVYSSDFKNEVSGNPEVLRDAKGIMDSLAERKDVSKGVTIEGDLVSVTYIGPNEQADDIKYFKIALTSDASKFFVKRVNLVGTSMSLGKGALSDGPREMIEMAQLKSDIQDVEGVRVLDYKLGYVDGTTSYCVSNYDSCLENRYDDEMFTDDRNDPVKQRYYKMLEAVGEKTRESGRRYVDFGGNVAYDKNKDQFVVFDLYLADGEVSEFGKV